MEPLLDTQKNLLKISLFSYFGRIVVLVFFTPVLIYLVSEFSVVFSDAIKEKNTTDILLLLLSFFVLLGMFALIILFTVRAVQLAVFYKKLKQISLVYEDTKELTFVKIYSIVLYAGRYSREVSGLILKDTNNVKWYYILPATISVSGSPLIKSPLSEMNKKLLNKKVSFIYYGGTNIIREIRLDMYEHHPDLK
ncbi:MAG: hypothetical protein E7388_04330 [Ruminococcaceae bacterium]|nr:hypothetical protein [Oscillospiraceae bacterium]